jgi:hypothetical protein
MKGEAMIWIILMLVFIAAAIALYIMDIHISLPIISASLSVVMLICFFAVPVKGYMDVESTHWYWSVDIFTYQQVNKSDRTGHRSSRSSAERAAREDIPADALKHEPVKAKKDKGISFAAWIALELAGILLAVFLMIPLTATGVSEWATYINLNKGYVSANINSPLTKWVMDNTDPSDVFLTSRWSMNRFILAGRPMYYGWPYYAWSAGHDTYTRETIYLWLISGCGDDIEEFTRYCKERRIKYLIVDQELIDTEFDNGVRFNKEFVEKNLTQVAYFAEEDTTIYKIY